MTLIDPVALTQELIRCQSVTPRDDGAQQILIDALTPMGFVATSLPFDDVTNFVARLGDNGPHLAYCGHTDVVPAGDAARWTYPPFAAQIANGVLYGRGASDMKGSNAAFVAAVSRFLAAYPDAPGSISVWICGDEEGQSINGMEKVMPWLAANGQVADVCLVGEPSNHAELGEALRIGRRGSQAFTITVTGVQGHVAYPERCHNPIPDLLHLLRALQEWTFDDGDDLFPPTQMNIVAIETGNPAYNVIPGAVRANVSYRFSPRWTSERLLTEARRILDAVGIPYDLAPRPPSESFLTPIGAWTECVRDAVIDITGRTPRYDAGGGTSDARFIAPYCSVVEFGPLNATIHKTDECIALNDLETLTRVYTRVLERFFNVG